MKLDKLKIKAKELSINIDRKDTEDVKGLGGTDDKSKEIYWRLILRFYRCPLFLTVILALFFYYLGPKDFPVFYLWVALLLIFLGNLIIAFITQFLHEFLGNKEHLFGSWKDCSTRCIAGVLEMVLYVLSLATGSLALIVGYLILKTLSVWKPERGVDNVSKKEGLSTAVLRIAVVLSLIFSLLASYFLFQFLQSFTIFNLNNHFLFKIGL